MNHIRRLVAIMVLMLSVFGSYAQDNDNRLKVVATTTQAADAVKILAGDLVDLTALMGAGVDPHLYQPTEANIRAMNEADLVIYSGLSLEGQFDEVFQALGERNIRIYAMSDPVKEAGFIIGGFDLSEELQDVDDPHYWFDPRNWSDSIMGIAEVLSEEDPRNAETYLSNAQAYQEDLQTLYIWALEAMSQVPEGQRVLVTSHDAFNYFGDAFGWEVRGLQGLSTEDEAGVGDVQSIVEFVIENEIPVMFVESSVPPDAIESVQEAAQAQGFDVGIGVRELFSDAMGDPDTFGGTYIGMLAQNVITVLQSYGFDIPEWDADLEPVPPTELLDMSDTEE